MKESDNIQRADEENDNRFNVQDQVTNRFMGMAAIFVSALSMIAVTYQSYLAREENKLMQTQQSAAVLPYLDYWYSNLGDEFKFVIANKGVGPAFIKDVQFIAIDANEERLTFSSSHQLVAFIRKQSTFIDSLEVVNSSLRANMLMSPNEQKVYANFTMDNPEIKRRFKKEFDKYWGGVKITYEDVFGTTWILDSNKGYPEKIIEE